eukprot:139167_1
MALQILFVLLILFTGALSKKSNQNGLIRRERFNENNRHSHGYYSNHKQHHLHMKHRNKHTLPLQHYSAMQIDVDTDTDTDTNDSDTDTDTENSTDVYSEKSQSTAFMFSLFLGVIGLDRFYVGDNIYGLVKLSLFLLVLIGPFVFVCCFSSAEIGEESGIFQLRCAGLAAGHVATFLWICGCITLIVWIICDITRFALNDIPDSEGQTLIPM